jgi:putative aldouronate transport system substrate-binding protein
MEKFAPDYYNLVKSNLDIWREVTTPENKFAAFYQLKPVTDPALDHILIRDEMLKDLGLRPPVLISEFTAMFKAHKDKTGKAAYIPTENGRDKLFMGAYGIFNAWYKDDNKGKFGPYDARYRQYLEQFAEWYRLGYLYNDFPSIRAPQRRSLLIQGEALSAQGDVDNHFIMGRDAGASFVATRNPRQRMGDKLHDDDWEAYPVKPAGGGVISVSNQTKYKEEAVRFLNYGYTPEGSLMYDFGVEGVTYTMVNGQPKLTEYALHNPDLTPEGVNYVLLAFHGPKLCRPGRDRNPNALMFPDVYQVKLDLAADPDVDKGFVLPTYTLTAEDATRAGRIMADVNTYVDEMTLKFITGAEPLSRFDAYMAQLRTYGIEDAIAMHQKAYDIYMTKKPF